MRVLALTLSLAHHALDVAFKISLCLFHGLLESPQFLLGILHLLLLCLYRVFKQPNSTIYILNCIFFGLWNKSGSNLLIKLDSIFKEVYFLGLKL